MEVPTNTIIIQEEKVKDTKLEKGNKLIISLWHILFVSIVHTHTYVN